MRSFVQSLAHSAKKLLLQIVVAVMCVPLLPIEFGTRCIFFTDSQCIEYNQWIVSSCIVLQNAIQYIILVSSNSIWYQQQQQKQQEKSKKRNKRGTQEKVAFDCIAVNWNIWHAVCMCMCGCVYEWCYLSAFAIHCQHWLFVLDTRTQIFFLFLLSAMIFTLRDMFNLVTGYHLNSVRVLFAMLCFGLHACLLPHFGHTVALLWAIHIFHRPSQCNNNPFDVLPLARLLARLAYISIN